MQKDELSAYAKTLQPGKEQVLAEDRLAIVARPFFEEISPECIYLGLNFNSDRAFEDRESIEVWGADGEWATCFTP